MYYPGNRQQQTIIILQEQLNHKFKKSSPKTNKQNLHTRCEIVQSGMFLIPGSMLLEAHNFRISQLMC